MGKCKKGISWFDFFILVSVFCVFNELQIVRANEGEDVILETNLSLSTLSTNLATEEIRITSLETKVLFNLTTSTQISSILPLTSSFVYHDSETSTSREDGVHSGSFLVGAMPIKVQKCCQPQQVLQLDKYGSECVDTQKKFVVDLFWANQTHYWNYTTSTAQNVTVVTRNPCNQSKYILDPVQDIVDTFHLLHNSSLYVPYSMYMLDIDSYCMDIVMMPSKKLLTTAVICTSDTPKSENLSHYIFGAGLVISVISLILLAVCTSRRSNINDGFKNCLTCLAGTMATSFFFEAISVFFGKNMSNVTNIILAYVVYYLKLKYSIWLNVLCYVVGRCIKHATDHSIKKRESYIKLYVRAAFVIPLLFIVINLFNIYNPALPNLYMEFSYLSSFLWALLSFYVPIIFSVCINMYIMLYSIVLPKRRSTSAPANFSQLRNMYRRTFILCCFMLIFLLLDLIIFFLPKPGAQFMIRNAVYCLQGLLVSCVFIRKNICQRITKNKHNTIQTKPLKTNGCYT